MSNAPTRSAVQDGNAGYVSAPSIKHTAGTQTVAKKSMSQDDLNIQKISKGLGNAFSGYIKEEVANLEEQQKLAGVAKAGMKKSMDEVDVDVKQSKFTDFIFGEDIEYRTAQQQVITNGVEAQYRNELANIDQYQGYTEREYGEVLKGALDKIADTHKNDPETKTLATNTWIQAAGKLVDKQHKTHFAYKQTQMRQIEHDTTMGRVDQMNIEEGEVTSPEDVRQYNLAWDNIWDPMVRPKGMSLAAKSSQTLEIANETLEAGTINMYKQGVIRNVWKNATPKQIEDRDKAIGKYDTQFNYKVNTTLEETVAALEGVTDIEVAKGMIDDVYRAVDQHETRQTGSAKSRNTIAEARSRIARMLPDLYKRVAKGGKKEADIAAAMEAARNYEYTRGVELHKFPKAIQEEAFDRNFLLDVKGMPGAPEELSGQEAAQVLLTNPELGKLYATKFKDGHEVVPILESGLKAMLSGISRMQDPETGMPTERWAKGMTFMEQLNEASPDRLAKMLGDDYKTFEHYRAATRAGMPVNEMVSELNNLNESIASGVAGVAYKVPEGMTKRQHVLESMGLQNLNTQSGTVAMDHWATGMKIYKQDFDLAKTYANRMVKTNSAIVGKGILVQNASQLQAELEGNDLAGIFDFISKSPELSTDLVRGVAGDITVQPSYRGWFDNLFGDDREATTPTQLGQIPGVTIEVAMDGDGIWIKAPNGRDRRMSTEQLRSIGRAKVAAHRKEELEVERMAMAELNKENKRRANRAAIFSGYGRDIPSTTNLTAEK